MMLEEWIRKLIEAYREDLCDYERIMEEMKHYHLYLEENVQNKERLSPDPQQTENVFEQALTQFSKFREEKYQDLKTRAEKTKDIQEQIERHIGFPFETSLLQPFLLETSFEELVDVTNKVTTTMNQVLKMDALIIPQLKMELEKVKLELHRLQGGKKTKEVYGNPFSTEARFIDKSK